MRTREVLAAALVAVGIGLSVPAAAADAPGGGTTGVATAAAVPKGWTLKGVVLFSRHGIRGFQESVHCTGSDTCWDAITTRPWPTFGVKAGNLAPQGVKRIRTLARYYRSLYAEAGLLPHKGCPEKRAVAFFDAGDERTWKTALTLADGMFPGCGYKPKSVNLAPASACEINPAEAAAATEALLGGSWQAIGQGELRRPLAAMSRALGPFRPGGCEIFGLAAGCDLLDISYDRDIGPIGIADQPAEQFLMQYVAGLSPKSVAWGRLPAVTGKSLPEAITFVNAVHALSFRGENMPTYQARRQGSTTLNLVAQDLEAMLQSAEAPRFVVYAGHDGEILNLGGMLGLEWQLSSYQPFQVPPGGAVAFELWQTGANAAAGQAVRLVYYAQTIEQMRRNTPLTPRRPPASVAMPVGGCSGPGDACPWSNFSGITGAAIVPSCVRPPSAN